jgi:dihydroflavonol-4-reductase
MSDDTILVTGATGLVGNNVTRILAECGSRVRVLVRGTSDPRPLEGLGVENVEGDICDLESVRRACEGVAAVIHSAGYVQLGKAHLDQHRRINVDGSRNVAIAAHGEGVRMIHVSSTDALGNGTSEQLADEETPLPPPGKCAYVITKREAEQAVLDEHAAGLDVVIVNPSFMLGPWDWKPSSGRMLLAVGNGSARLAPRGAYSVADVRDVAMGILAALDRGVCGQRYILAGENLSYLDAWRRFAKVIGAKPPLFAVGPMLAAIGGRGGDVWARLTGREPDVNSAAIALARRSKMYSSARAQRELDFQNRPLDETIREAWDWLVEYGYARRR